MCEGTTDVGDSFPLSTGEPTGSRARPLLAGEELKRYFIISIINCRVFERKIGTKRWPGCSGNLRRSSGPLSLSEIDAWSLVGFESLADNACGTRSDPQLTDCGGCLGQRDSEFSIRLSYPYRPLADSQKMQNIKEYNKVRVGGGVSMREL